MINVMLAVLVEKEIITRDEAEYLAKELVSGIMDSNFNLAVSRIQGIFESYRDSVAKKKQKPVANEKSS